VFHHRTACAQYRQIDIWIILGKIGFEWFSAHAEGFLKAVLGASPPVKVQVKCSTLEHSGNHWMFRLTGQLALLRYHFPVTRKCNFINVPI
jgi:hypothetical protein